MINNIICNYKKQYIHVRKKEKGVRNQMSGVKREKY